MSLSIELALEPQTAFDSSSIERSSFDPSIIALPQLSNLEFDDILETKLPVPQEQLLEHIKGVYAGLQKVEAKCIKAVNEITRLTSNDLPTQSKLNNEQWQGFIDLHRTLIQQHYRFFLASQHPSASPDIRHLALEYAMPGRLWVHGAYSYLIFLSLRLPDLLDHTNKFTYMVYSALDFLYEAIPSFRDTWAELSGHVAFFRAMKIPTNRLICIAEEIAERNIWKQIVYD
ncbi:hypothetical protein EAF04_005705 [Stromatinia cepivora]|nr:hypothetical protein EAF04_005705 [Stromatinia cepivora]